MVKNKLLIVSILVISIVSLFVLPVFAEVNEDLMVNFNQHIQDTYINYSTDSYFVNSLPVGKYYIRINSNVNTRILFVYTGGSYFGKSITIGQNDFIIDITNAINAIQFNNSITYTGLNAINLTQMFGAGNEPTLEECKKIFPATYPYNEGTVISTNYIQSYMNGVNSVLESLKYDIVASDVYNNLQGVRLNNNYYGVVTQWPNQNGNNLVVVSSYNNNYTPIAYYPFNSGLTAGSTITLNGLIGGWHASIKSDVTVGYVSNNGALVDIITFKDRNLGSEKINYTFVLPQSIGGLYFYNDGSTDFYLGDFTISVVTQNVNALISDAYKNGQENIKALYKPGAVEYNIIFNKGKEAAEYDYSFLNLFGSAIEAPVNAVLSMFDFNVLGYNMRSFMIGLFSVALVIAVIRIFV